MLENLKSFDQFGQQYPFKLRGKSSFRTRLGLIFSVIFWGVILMGTIYFVSELYDETKVETTITRTQGTEYPLIKQVDDEIVMLMGLSTGSYAAPVDNMDKLMTIVGKTTSVDKDGVPTYTQFGFKLCGNMLDQDIVVKYTRSPLIKSLLFSTFCPDITDPEYRQEIQGDPSNPPYSTVNYEIYPCSLPNPGDCLPPEVVLKNFPTWVQTRKFLKLTSKKNPIDYIVASDFITLINPYASRKLVFKYDKYLIKDKTSLFFQAKVSQSFFDNESFKEIIGIRDGSLYCTKASILDRTCQPYTSVEFRSSKNIVEIERQYVTVLEVVSNIGGYGDLSLMVLSFLSFFYVKKKYLKWLSSELTKAQGTKSYQYLKDNLKENEYQQLKIVSINDKLANVDSDFLLNFGSKSLILNQVLFDEDYSQLLPIIMLEVNRREMNKNQTQSSLLQQQGGSPIQQAIQICTKFNIPQRTFSNKINTMFLNSIPEYLRLQRFKQEVKPQLGILKQDSKINLVSENRREKPVNVIFGRRRKLQIPTGKNSIEVSEKKLV